MNKKTVLVVDDSPFIHKAIARAVKDTEYEICAVAQNGRQGVECYDVHRPLYVTMDITMPVMDGLEAAKAILAGHPEAKIIMLSAMGDDDLLERAKSLGVRCFLQKPFKPDQLLSALQSV